MTPQKQNVEDKPASDLTAEAGAPEIEITPAMIEAGVNAYYENYWENPTEDMLAQLAKSIFEAMWNARHMA